MATPRRALPCSKICATAMSLHDRRALVALEGVDDLVVVATQDAVLVSRQKDANGLKRLVAKLKAVAPQVTEDHLKVHRPWGSYQSVDMGERHQVKRIVVKPGGRLSLQKHHHRSEHWIVVRGAARVTVNDVVKVVHENRSIYIPDRCHPSAGKSGQDTAGTDLKIQTGSSLGEDDIIRIEHRLPAQRVNRSAPRDRSRWLAFRCSVMLGIKTRFALNPRHSPQLGRRC